MIVICGVIGFVSNHVTPEDLQVVKQVMIESRIRGKHASGVAWFDGKRIRSYVKPIAIDALLNEFNLEGVIHSGQVAMIAHARYSTSNIKYNQPIVGKTAAIAHNGVITQASPDTWEQTYGYKCKTKNDSELLLKAYENYDDPLKAFPSSSIAAVVLTQTGKLGVLRNSQRPLWTGTVGEGTIYASTYDILNRAGVKNIHLVESSDHKDLQRRNITQWNKMET